MSTNKFIVHLSAELMNAVNKNYKDNYDHNRFGKEVAEKGNSISIKKRVISWINKLGYFNDFNNHLYSKEVEKIDYPLTDFIYLYNLLEDEYSRDLLIKIVAYRMLGYKKVKLPLSKPLFWQNQQLIESHQSENDFIDIHFMDTRMPLTDLAFLGVPVKMYYSALGINIDFIIKQYELHRSEVHIEAEPGDFVIDAGGCFGDTALYFANKVGENGAVHVFEFIPDNIEVLKKNISLNMHLKQIIKLIPNPLWSSSGDDVFYASNGPASRVSMEAFEGYTNKTTTLSIDEYFRSEKIPVINFIKMDIEGAELNALKGAEDTIRQFKPKLAIALYHSTAEFDSIPRYINELNLGYKFYLSHSTIYGEETMLFATTEK